MCYQLHSVLVPSFRRPSFRLHMVTASSPVVSIRYDTTAVQGGALGIFFDPCPTGDLLGGCTKRSVRTLQLFGCLAVLEPHTL